MNVFASLGGSRRLESPIASKARHICPVCGKAFYAGKQWGYAHTTSTGGHVYYCSYPCFRVWERAEDERIQQKVATENDQYEKYLNYAREYARRKKEKHKAGKDSKSRIQLCEEKIAHYAALAAANPSNSRKRANARDNASKWRRELARCRMEGGCENANQE